MKIDVGAISINGKRLELVVGGFVLIFVGFFLDYFIFSAIGVGRTQFLGGGVALLGRRPVGGVGVGGGRQRRRPRLVKKKRKRKPNKTKETKRRCRDPANNGRTPTRCKMAAAAVPLEFLGGR